MDELVERPVENCLRIAGFVLRPVILDQLVRVEYVAADLAPEIGLLRLTALAGELLLPFLLLELRQARLEDPQRRLLVRGLRALVLNRDDSSCRQVRDPNRGIGLVDVLATGATSAMGVDAQLALVDVDCLVLWQQRADDHLREGSVAAM